MRFLCRDRGTLHRVLQKLLCFLFVFSSYQLYAQTGSVSGVIKDSAGAGVAGATVSVANSKSKSISSNSGAFTIAAKQGDVLTISAIGYSDEQLTIGSESTVTVSLRTSVNSLNDVVVLAYGSQKRRDITGSVAIVNVAESKKYSTNDVSQLLQGRASGVQVTSDGQPGASPNVRIRGIGTFGNNQPLYVIDGVQLANAIRDISPNDIQSIQVLKDASAAALYGSQAANGVIIITTKQGRKNSPLHVEYNGYYGVDNVWQKIPVTSRVNYQLLNNEARTNAGKPLAPANDPSSPSYITNIDVDWQKEGLKQGNRQDHNIAFSGGGANTTYNVSLDYFGNKGTYVGNGPDYNRYTARVNTAAEKGIFKIGENMFYTHSHENLLTSTTSNDLAGAQPPLITTLDWALPTLPIYDSTKLGGYGGTLSTLQDEISLNGIGVNSLVKNFTDVDRTFANVYGELQLLKTNGHSLKYRLNLSYDKTQTRDFSFKPAFDLGYFFQSPIAKLDDNTRVYTAGLVENTLTYQKSFGLHAVEVLAGQTYDKSTALVRTGHAEGFAQPYLPQLSNGATSAATGNFVERARLSYIGRINYNYDERYLLTGSIRRDASSNFSPAHSVGYFPSASVGWRLTNEKFIKLPKNIVSDIKLRASYGVLGNDNIPFYAFQPVINTGIVYTFDGTRYVGGLSTNFVDKDIKWESKATTNVGIDATLFRDNLDVSAEYYKNKATDILVGVPIPASVGSLNANPIVNAGSIENSGFEFTATYHKRKGGFTFDISANLSTVKNKVLALGGNGEPIYGVGSRTIVGSEVGEQYGWVYEGIFQTQTEVDAHAFQTSKTAPGDIKFKDISGPAGKPDGVIDSYDRTVLGSSIPKYNYGFNFTAGYKGFDISLFVSGSAKYLINDRLYRSLLHTGGSANYSTDMLNRWTPTNTNTSVPRLDVDDPNNNGRDSNRPGWLEKGTFLRINTFSLGYNIKDNLIRGISNIRVYVTAQNLYTFQSYKGYNPDFTSGVFNPGYDDGSYPKPRTIMGGIQVSF